MINPGYDVVVLPPFACVGNVVQVSAVSVARAVSVQPDVNRPLPPHLEDIVAGSHPSLGDEGRATLRNILHQYAHVFPALGDPVTGRFDMRLKLTVLGLSGVGHAAWH